jgi:perosamine synthetase
MRRKISVASPVFSGNEKKYVNDCIDTTWISSSGKYISEFETKFAEFCGVKHALSCSNGTVAIHLALMAIGIKEGDEVIVPTLTYIASANAVRYCGATPVFADCDRCTWNLDADAFSAAITDKTRAVIVVPLYGNPADMDAIIDIARKHNIYVIEDAAEAHGATYKGKKTGSMGDMSSFSFFGNKIITTGEGGMVTTNSDELAAKMRLLKGQGMDPAHRYWFNIVGYNYRMTNIEAAIGLAQLENIDEHMQSRRRVSAAYMKELSELQEYIEFQKEQKNATHVQWMFSILLRDTVKKSRDELIEFLAQNDIETRPVFYPMHVMPPYYENKSYPNAEYISQRGINLPSHGLLTQEDIVFVCDKIREFIKS